MPPRLAKKARILVHCGILLQLTGPVGPGREDKNVDVAVGAIVAKVEDVKASLSSFIAKMEREPLTWYICITVCPRIIAC